MGLGWLGEPSHFLCFALPVMATLDLCRVPPLPRPGTSHRVHPLLRENSYSVVPVLRFADNGVPQPYTKDKGRRTLGWVSSTPVLCPCPLSLRSALAHTACSCQDARQISLLFLAEGIAFHSQLLLFSGLSPTVSFWLEGCICGSALLPTYLLFVPSCPPLDALMCESLRHPYIFSRESFGEL